MISILNTRGEKHNNCEDSVFLRETHSFIWGGVLDGCGSGIKSHWASQTFAYMFEKLGDPTLDYSLRKVKKQLQDIVDILQLDTSRHALSTMVLFSYDKVMKQLKIRVIGDGYYYINDVEYSVEQNNIPDYFAYHMDDMDSFLTKYPVLTYYDVSSFKVCSDGIKSIAINQFHNTKLDPMALLLHPPTSENYLTRMWHRLHLNHFTISDDLSIISYVRDE